MITRIVHTKIWKDDFFVDLNPTEKLLFLYYLTNERINIIHFYEVSFREIIFDTGLDKSIITKSIEKFSQAKKILFYKNFVFLPNAYRYENYRGSKNDSAKAKLISKLPQDVRNWYFTCINTPINTPISTSVDTPSIGSINHKSENINQKTEVSSAALEALRETVSQIGRVK